MKEMNKLETYLKEHEYKYKKTYKESISVFDDNDWIWSVDSETVEYLSGHGEIFNGMPGYLTADEIISRLEALDG